MKFMAPLCLVLALLCAGCEDNERNPNLEAFMFPTNMSSANTISSFERSIGSIPYTLPPPIICRIFFVDSPFEPLDGYGPFGGSAGQCDSTIAMDNTGMYGPVMRNLFHRTSPIPFLNIEVAYSDSIPPWTDSTTIPFASVIGRIGVIKIFNREPDFDDQLPDWANKEPMQLDEFLELYRDLKLAVAKLAVEQGMSGSGTINYGKEDHFLDDLPYKDAFEITEWHNTRTSSGLLLACMPTKPLRNYYIRSSADYTLRYNPTKQRIDSIINSEDPGVIIQSDWFQAYDIRPSDLAIWIVYDSGKLSH